MESDTKTQDIRPQSFSDYIGQPQAKTVLQILCNSAKKKGSAISHTMIAGRPGLGKTTLCRIMANEMGSKLIELVASNLQDPQQLTAQLAQLEENDILFIDEIHSLPRAVEEVLYGAMEDGCISMVVESEYGSLMKNLGMSSKQTRTLRLNLPAFTLIGATTLAGLVSAPLRSRFVQTIDLDPYSLSDLESIVQNAGKRLGFPVSKTAAKKIAKRSRSTARIALGHLRWLIEFCNAMDTKATVQAVDQAFQLKGIDAYGLTKVDRSYLEVLVQAKGPVGLGSLCASLGENSKTLIESIEPFLMQEGFIRRVNRGRVAEQKAFDLLS